MANFAVVHQAAPAGTGTQDYTSSGFGTPVAAIFYVARVTSTGSTTAESGFSFGVTDGTSEWAINSTSQDAQVGATASSRETTTSYCILVNNQGLQTTDGSAAFSAWITDGVRINWDDAPASQYLVTCVLIGGDISNAHVGTVDLGDSAESEYTVTAPGFRADVGFAVCSDGLAFPASSGEAMYAIGMWTNDSDEGGAINQAVLHFQDVNNQATSATIQGMRSDAVVMKNTDSAFDWWGSIDDNASGFTVTTENAGANDTEMAYLVLGLPSTLHARLAVETVASSSGVESYTGYGCTPEILFTLCGGQSGTLPQRSSDDTSECIAFGVSVGTGASDEYVGCTHSDDNVSTTDTHSRVDTATILHLTQSGASPSITYEATTDSFYGGGYDLNYSTESAGGELFIALAIGLQAHPIPVAGHHYRTMREK